MKKWGYVLLALFLELALSGCNFSGLNDAQALMSPPKANADQQNIHQLLQGNRQEITFIYPKSGEYRSAVIMRDFTGDGIADALGFCASKDNSVEAQFLVSSGQGQWRTAAVFENTATQVDRVLFGDLNGDGISDVLIGWGSASGVTGRTALVCAYLLGEDGQITEYSLGTYGDMTLTDFDGDGVQELFTVDKFVASEEEGGEGLPATARVFAYRDGSIQEIFSANADNSITNYVSVSFGRIAHAYNGVVLDGAKADGSMTTQLFLLDPEVDELKNIPSGINTENYVTPFSRPSTAPFLSRDINGDGIIDIPVTTLLPGIADTVTPDSTSYQVDWCIYDGDNGARKVLCGLMNLNENYWFELPYGLRNKITSSNDVGKRTVTYTALVSDEKGEELLLGAPLFNIRVFTRSAWDSRGETSGYEQLAVQNDLVYGIQVLTTESRYAHSIEQVKENFKLISE